MKGGNIFSRLGLKVKKEKEAKETNPQPHPVRHVSPVSKPLVPETPPSGKPGPWTLDPFGPTVGLEEGERMQRPRVEMSEKKRAFSKDALILNALFADLLRIVCGHLKEDKDYLAFRHSCVDFFKVTEAEQKRMDGLYLRYVMRIMMIRDSMRYQACEGRPYISAEDLLVVPKVEMCVGKTQRFPPRPKGPELDSITDLVALVKNGHVQGNLEEWLEMATAEHASIGSFALVAQKLMAISGPAEMLHEALLCAQEEIGHAELAFAVATALGAAQPQPVYAPHTVFISNDEERVLVETIEEGCVEESIGALDAARKSDNSTCPILASVWKRVAIDEAYHASFGWRVVSYLVEKDDSKKRLDLFKQTFDQSLSKRGTDSFAIMLNNLVSRGESVEPPSTSSVMGTVLSILRQSIFE